VNNYIGHVKPLYDAAAADDLLMPIYV